MKWAVSGELHLPNGQMYRISGHVAGDTYREARTKAESDFVTLGTLSDTWAWVDVKLEFD